MNQGAGCSKFKATCDVCTPHNGDGIYAVNSANLQIGTGPDCPANGPCHDLTYDDGFGATATPLPEPPLNPAEIGTAMRAMPARGRPARPHESR